jgi:hypothetical protein
VGWLVVQQVLQPRCQALQVLVACGQDARVDQHFPDVVQGLVLRQVIEQVVGDGVACPSQAAEQPGRPARAEPAHHSGRVGDRAERLEQGMQLLGDFPAGTGEQDPGAFGQDAAEAAPGCCGSSLPGRTHGRCSPARQPRHTGRRPAFLARRCRSAAAPPRSLRTRRGGGGHARSSRRRLGRRAIPPGPGGRVRTGSTAGEGGPAAAADRAARGDSLAGPCFPACRADRRHAFVAAVAQVGGGCCGPPGDLAGLPAVPAWPLRSLVARGADRAGIGGPGDGALLAAGRAHAGRAGSAELAASAAVRHPGGRPASPAAPAAFRHDLLVLVIAGRADPALGAPGVDPPGPAAAGACSGAPAGRAGSADPAGGGLAPQVGSDLAAPGQAGAATV